MIREIKGWHVLAAMIAFFGVTIAVNATFITLAVTSFSGEEAPKSYRQGLHYNEVLDRRAEQAALGWRASLAAGADRLALTIQTAGGEPVTGLSLTGAVKHPTNADFDRALDFQPDGPGVYRAALAEPLGEGAWIISAEDPDAPFAVERRVRIE